MFLPGTRVAILSSSSKKSVGPREGSIGFVGFQKEASVISNIACASVADIYFTRFGFEQKHRMERKPVLCLFPIVEPKADAKDSVKVLKEGINNFSVNGRDPFSSEIRDRFGGFFSSDFSVAMAAPINDSSLNLLECNWVLFKAWFSCFLESDFLTFISEVNNSNHLKKFQSKLLNTPSVWQTFLRAGLDRSRREDLFQSMHEQREKREEIVYFIKTVLALMACRKNANGNRMLIAEYARAYNRENCPISDLFRLMSQYIFCPAEMAEFTRICRKLNSSNMNSLASNVETMVLDLVLSARDLVCKKS